MRTSEILNTKELNGGAELVALIAKVIQQNQVDVVGFCEIRSKLGDDIGKELTEILNGNKTGLPWKYKPSTPFGKNRWEQYLFVWNTTKATTYGPLFKDTFTNPAPPPANLGFPRQSQLDRPPYLGFFQTVTNAKKVLIAVMHSPAPSPSFRPKEAANNMAEVADFSSAVDACLLMGDFNVKISSDAATAGSLGEAAFGPLVTGKNFTQLLPGDILSSLISLKQVVVGMTINACYSMPYDQLFLRAKIGISYQKQSVKELISASLNTNPTQYLQAVLAKVNQINYGVAPAAYTTVEDAFDDFRFYVSDHMPVFVEIHG